MRKPPNFCAYCGSTTNLTDDHVPPASVFAPPRPSDLMTVRACQQCHSPTSKDDEYFRLKLCISEKVGEHPDAKKNRQIIARSMNRRKAVGFTKSILNDTFFVDARTPAGLYLGKRLAFNVDLHRVFRVVQRIVRGVFCVETHQRLPDAYEVRVHSDDTLVNVDAETMSLLQETILVPLARMEPRVIGNNVFAYRFHQTKEDPFASVWGLTFYGRISFLAMTGPSAIAGFGSAAK